MMAIPHSKDGGITRWLKLAEATVSMLNGCRQGEILPATRYAVNEYLESGAHASVAGGGCVFADPNFFRAT